MRRLLAALAPALLFSIPYEVTFVGLDNPTVLNSIRDVADLITLQDRPPPSINGIRYRIANDIPEMIKVLQAYGYYDATITSDVQLENDSAKVTLQIHSGPQYTLSLYQVFQGDCTLEAQIPCCAPLTPEHLGLTIGSPALSVNIVNAELNILTQLSRCGYPLASVEKRKVIIDMAHKQMEAAACIKEGPLSEFGPLSIFGVKSVKPSYILDRIAWEEGQIYNTDFVAKTQKRLLDSDLFSSVYISHGDELDANGQLPMKLRLTEAKHKQISFGVFYATVDGPGGVFSWTNRNFRGVGESINLNGEFSKRYLAGTLTFKKRDFFKEDQTLRAIGQIERQDITAYIAFIYRAVGYLDFKRGDRGAISVGLEAQHVNVAASGANGSYNLIDAPMIFKYNGADDLLNPTKGYTIVYQPHLFQSLDQGETHFFKQRLTTTAYLPIQKKWLILAMRMQLGSILGTSQKNVPLPILFLGGSEDDLRGYRYLTVSPLNENNKPLGGRSAIFFSVEPRFRFGDFGIVPFADFGTVTFNSYPTIHTNWYKSVGVGLRYFTFFGPLRFDIGFPLDRRSIDPAFRIYASIGQTF